MLKIRQFAALAKMTAIEAIRQPVCLLLAVSGILFTIITPLMVVYKFGEDGKFARESGLAFHLIFGLIIAAYTAGTSLSKELRTGTASSIISKPVSRTTLFMAKFTGISSVIILFSIAAIAATLLSERIDEKFVFNNRMVGYFTDWHTAILLLTAIPAALIIAAGINYFTKRAFESSAFILFIISILFVFVLSGFFNRVGQYEPFDYRVDWRILPAGILVTFALIVLTAIATTISTRLNAIATTSLCFFILMAGLISDYFPGRYINNSVSASILYKITPNWQNFWVADALTGGGHIPLSYLETAFIYAAIYTAGILILGIFSFGRTEIT